MISNSLTFVISIIQIFVVAVVIDVRADIADVTLPVPVDIFKTMLCFSL